MHPVGYTTPSFFSAPAAKSAENARVRPVGPRFSGQVTELQDAGLKFYNSPKTLVENQAFIERKGGLHSKSLAKKLQNESLMVLTGPPDAGLDILMEATMASYKTAAREKTPTIRHNGPLGRSDWNQLVFLINGNRNAEAQILALNNAQEALQQEGPALFEKLKTLLEKNPNLKVMMAISAPPSDAAQLKETLLQGGTLSKQLIEVPSLTANQKYQWLNVILNNADFALLPQGTVLQRLGQKIKTLVQSVLNFFGKKPKDPATPTINWHSKIIEYLDTSQKKTSPQDKPHTGDSQGLDHHVRSLLLAFAAYFKTVPNRLDEQKKDTKEFITPEVIAKLPWNPLLDGSVL